MHHFLKSRWQSTNTTRIKLVRYIGLVLITGIAVYRCFFGLGVSPLARWDEYTNVHVVKESLTHNIFPVLWFEGKPFFEKPPLWYMVSMIIGHVTGISPLSMRFVSAASGVAIIMLTTWIGYSWFGTIAGITSGLLLLSTGHVFIQNPGGFFSSHTYRSADVDALQQILILLSVWLFWKALARPLYGYLAIVCSGLAFLTKGPLALIPCVYGCVFLIQKNVFSQRHIGAYTGILLLTVAPWYIYMALRYGFTFLQDNIWYHMLLRSVSALEGHTEPWWFYLSVLRSRAIFPSIELLGLSFVFFITRKNIFRDYRIAMPIILVLSITGVVSLMQTKLAWYVLPIYPYAALMIGHTFSSGLRYTLAYTHKQWNP